MTLLGLQRGCFCAARRRKDFAFAPSRLNAGSDLCYGCARMPAQGFIDLYHTHLRGHFPLTDRLAVIRNADTVDDAE